MKVDPDKFNKISTALVRLYIEFLTAELSSQSDIENYVTRDNIDNKLILPNDGNNRTFSECMLRFRNNYAERHTRE